MQRGSIIKPPTKKPAAETKDKDAPKLPVSTRLKSAAKNIITAKYSTNLKEATALSAEVDAAQSLATLIPVVSRIVFPLIGTALKTDVAVRTFRTVYEEATVIQQKKDVTLKGHEASILALQAKVAEQKTALETAAKTNASFQTDLEKARRELETEKSAAKEREAKALQEATNKLSEAALLARSAALEKDTLIKELAAEKAALLDMTAKRELAITAKDQAVTKLTDETEKNRMAQEKSKALDELMQSRLATAKEDLLRKEKEVAALSVDLLKANQPRPVPQTPAPAVLREQKTAAPKERETPAPRQTSFPAASAQFFATDVSQSAAPIPGQRAVATIYTEAYFMANFKNLFNANAINVLEEMRTLISRTDPKERVYIETMQEFRFQFICLYLSASTNEELKQTMGKLEEKMKGSKTPLEASLSDCANEIRITNITRFPQGQYGIAKLLNQAYGFSKNSSFTGSPAHRGYFAKQMNELDPKKKGKEADKLDATMPTAPATAFGVRARA